MTHRMDLVRELYMHLRENTLREFNTFDWSEDELDDPVGKTAVQTVRDYNVDDHGFSVLLRDGKWYRVTVLPLTPPDTSGGN